MGREGGGGRKRERGSDFELNCGIGWQMAAGKTKIFGEYNRDILITHTNDTGKTNEYTKRQKANEVYTSKVCVKWKMK